MYYLVLIPDEIINPLIDQSKKINRSLYDQEIEGLYYRMETKQELEDTRKLFIKGDGEVLELDIKPHLSLVHNINLETDEYISEFNSQVQKVLENYGSITLKRRSVGDYGKDFTFYVDFDAGENLEIIRNNLLNICKSYQSDEEYEQHLKETFVPHMTVLYDELGPKKVEQAQKIFDISYIPEEVEVDEVVLWDVTLEEQKVVKRFKLL